MDRIDVLGDQYGRYKLFSNSLLAETDDEELQQIVKEASEELNTPMGLVSLMLDKIQFFKAHIGLPEILQTSRGTHRDASFCQFVVKNGEAFEVNDAPNDPRIPKHVVKEFNINSYLGVPIKIEDAVIGALCVLDTKKRKFTKEERELLTQLSQRVNQRLEAITKKRNNAKLNLTYSTLDPAFKEIASSIEPIQKLLDSGQSHIATIRSFLNIANQFISVKNQHSETIKMSLEAAIEANELLEDRILNIEMNVLNSLDSVNALNHLLSNISGSNLSSILISAQDLTRNATKTIGGFPLPELDEDFLILAKSNLAIALISNSLLILASELKELNSKKGIELDIEKIKDFVDIKIYSTDLTNEKAERLYNHLHLMIGDEQPNIALNREKGGIKISFKTTK